MLLIILLSLGFAIFVIGNIARVVRTMRAPTPLRWELYPIPKGARAQRQHGGSYFEQSEWWTRRRESGRGGEIAFMLGEVLLLKSVRESFKELWLWSWLLHWGLYLYIMATVAWIAGIASGSFQLQIASGDGYAVACALGVLGSLGLLLLRSNLDRLRPYSSRASFFNLGLLAAFFATGGLALPHAMQSVAQALPRRWLPATASPLFDLHLLLLAFFLAYFPFTHMTHAYMKFFTWHGIRWDEAPAVFDADAPAKLGVNLQRTLTWSAPHIGSGATWSHAVADIEEKGSGRHG